MAWPENWQPNQAPQNVVLVDPSTGVPYASGGASGSVTVNGVNGSSAATGANPLATRDYGSASISTAQVSVGTAATQIVAARPGRLQVTITMMGNADVFLGHSTPTVTAANGALLLGTKGSSVTLQTQAAVFGIGGTAQTVSVIELF